MGIFYQVGREMTRPYTSGKLMGESSYEELRTMSTTLTEEERCSSFAHYYDEPMAPLAAEHEAALRAGPLLATSCYMPKETGHLLLSATSSVAENGYGVLPNGVGYAAIRILQNGVTDEMIRKYREEFAHDGPRTLFYKIWFPGAHLIHYENGVVEDFGWGMLKLEMDSKPFLLRHLGLTDKDIRDRDSSCLCLLGLCGQGWELNHPEQESTYTCMVQHIRETPQGRELRVRYWSGILFQPDGTLAYRVDLDRTRTQEHMRLMAEHCMREYQNELRLIKHYWNHEEQTKGQV